MQPTFAYHHLIFLGIAIALDVVANVLIKFSNGLQHKLVILAAIFFALAAFTALSFAIEGIQLSVAYGVWGGLGLVATAWLGMLLFRERLSLSGWLGMLLVILGVLLLKFAHLF